MTPGPSLAAGHVVHTAIHPCAYDTIPDAVPDADAEMPSAPLTDPSWSMAAHVARRFAVSVADHGVQLPGATGTTIVAAQIEVAAETAVVAGLPPPTVPRLRASFASFTGLLWDGADDPVLAKKREPAVAARRERLQRFVQGTLGAGVAMCVVALACTLVGHADDAKHARADDEAPAIAVACATRAPRTLDAETHGKASKAVTKLPVRALRASPTRPRR